MNDTNFLHWLSETVAEAALTADQHEALKRAIRELRVSVEARFGLASVQVRDWTPVILMMTPARLINVLTQADV